MKKDPWRGVSRVFFVREGFPTSTHRLKEAGIPCNTKKGFPDIPESLMV